MMHVPENWPDEIEYSSESLALEVHPLILRSMLAVEEEGFSDLIEEKRVHSGVEIRFLGKEHPIGATKTSFQRAQRGLFATQNLEEGTDLGEYSGEMKIMSVGWEQPSLKSHYYWVVRWRDLYYVVDAMRYGNELAMVNDFRGIGKKPNVQGKMIVHRGHCYFGYGTITPIKKGEEILVDYGEAFVF